MSFPSIEIHIPISPTPTMLNMLRCYVLSLRRFGGKCASAHVVATVGAPDVLSRLKMCEQRLAGLGIELRTTPEEVFKKHEWHGTGVHRLTSVFRADVVILADADTLVSGSLEAVVQQVYDEQAIAGVIAYGTPWGKSKLTWKGLFQSAGLPAPRREYTFSDQPGRCPAYFNYGFVVGSYDVMKRAGEIAWSTLESACDYAGGRSYFSAQVGLCLLIAELASPVISLPLRYNFSFRPGLERKHAAEIPHVCVIHLCRAPGTDKRKLYSHIDKIEAFTRIEAFTNREYPATLWRRAADVFRAILPSLRSSQS